ncbi:MAG: hypothetical protein OXI48_08655, partial [bacterium]|nr:hypothetical protein [bacterium]
QPLPPEFGLKNLLRNRFAVKGTRLNLAHRVLMDSAEQAGFFATRGSKTHLIMPAFHAAEDVAAQDSTPSDRGGGGPSGGGEGSSSGGEVPPTVSAPPEAPSFNGRDAYLSALINVFEARGKEGDIQDLLMKKIEDLIGDEPRD